MARTARSRARGLATVALAAGCGEGGGSTGAGGGAAKSDTLVLANAVNVDTLDPAANSVNESIWIDPEHLQPAPPAERERHRRHPAPGDVVGHLRRRPRPTRSTCARHQFSDGSPVTAEDVRFSIERSINYEGGWGFLLEAVKIRQGAEPQTVVVTLSRAACAAAGRPRDVRLRDRPRRSSCRRRARRRSSAARRQRRVHGHEPGTRAASSTLAVNPHWYGTKPKIKNVKVMIVPNDNSRVLLLQNKEADVIENPPGQPDRPAETSTRTC